MVLRRLIALCLFLTASTLHGEAPGVYAITGATVHPASGPDIPNGVVIIRGGLIEAVGANVPIPPDATTIDATGQHVYPGLIDAHTSLGFASAPRRTGGPGGGGGGAAASPERTPEPAPDALAIRNVRLTDDDIDARRAIGVTTIVTAPATGIFNGQSVILNLSAGPAESRVIKSPAALQVSFNPRPTWTYPDSLMGVLAYIRQTFLDAQQYRDARTVYDRNPSGLQRPPESPSLDALQPVLRRELPVVFVADTETMIRRVQTLAKDIGVRPIIAGVRQGYAMADELKGIPLFVAVKWPTAPTNKDDREEQPLRVIKERRLAPTTPATLVKSGAQFALVTGSGKTGDFLPGIRKAIDNGLTADDALRATTLWPARILGVDRQLGSLERGKIANVVVSDKPLFEKEAKVKRVFVDGRETRLPADDKAKPGDAAAAAAPAGETSPLAGSWALSVRTPQGNVQINVTLSVADGKVSGTFSGDRGSGDIRGGTFDGTTFDFSISAQTGTEGGEMSDWIFRGTLSGDSMEGNVTTTIGTFQFSGSRSR